MSEGLFLLLQSFLNLKKKVKDGSLCIFTTEEKAQWLKLLSADVHMRKPFKEAIQPT